MRHLHLEPVNTPKAVTWCGLSERHSTWPYVRKCERPVVGKLSEQDYLLIESEFDPSNKNVCQFHADRIEEYLIAVLND